MSIALSDVDYKAIEAHGKDTFPHECCGFLLGTTENGAKRVTELMPVANDREEAAKHNRFEIAPEDYMRCEKHARATGLQMLGVYHSHPDHPAKPSQTDLDSALPVFSYIIVSIMAKKAEAMTSWLLKEDRSAFDEEAIERT